MMRRLSLSLSAVLLVAGCGSVEALAPGNDETGRVARVVSDAIGWPRQESAMGYARAAAATTAGQDGRLTVVEVTELEAENRSEPFGELTFLVHLEGSTGGWVETDPVTACYRTEFGHYGVVGSPRRTRCPDDAAAVQIPDLPPVPAPIEIPDDADRLLRAQLRRLARIPEAEPLEGRPGGAVGHAGRPAPPDAYDDRGGPRASGRRLRRARRRARPRRRGRPGALRRGRRPDRARDAPAGRHRDPLPEQPAAHPGGALPATLRRRAGAAGGEPTEAGARR